MGEISGLLIAAVTIFMLLTGFYIILGDLSGKYNPVTAPEDIRMQNATQETFNLAAQMSNTTQSEEVTSGEFFGIPASISINILTGVKLIFKLGDIFTSLTNNAFMMIGDLGLGWAQSYILAIISIVILFAFINMILRYNA